ncbi:MAG TPA: MFS transporter [Candidatus Acidoferrum sp.]|nr:MFS transporter [Candidatus Acidoferrum sp.]
MLKRDEESQQPINQDVRRVMASSTTRSEMQAKRKHYGLIALLSAGFILTGFPTIMNGPILPTFISRWNLTDSQAGLFFTVQFTSSLAAVWITTGLTAWRGYRPGLVIGYILTGIGLALLNSPTQGVALLATALYGMGYGLVVPPTNLAGAEAGGAGVVSLLNFAWGIGAVACAPLVSVSLRHHSLTRFFWVLAGVGFALAAAFVFAPLPEKHHDNSTEAAKSRASVPSVGITTVTAALFFLYVGSEAGIGGWAAEHVKRLLGHATELTTMTPLFFYAGMMVGRGVASLLLSRIGSLRFVILAFSLSILGIVTIIAAHSPHVAIAGFTIAGLGCATIYPIYISWFSHWYGPAARRLGGVVFSMASLGGSALPWLVGFVSTKANSLPIGFLVPLAGMLVMAVLVTVLRKRGLQML